MEIRDNIYKYLTEEATDIIYTISLDSSITFYNKAIEKIFEMPINEIIDGHYTSLMLPKDKELAKKLHDERLQGKSSVFEHGFKTPKGKLVYLEISANPIFDENGEVIASLGIGRDVTERRMAQEELKMKKQELEEMVHLKDKFLSIVAHDLRDPFNILIGYSDLILNQIDDISSEKLKQYILNINSSSNNAYNLLNNILDWSKTQSGKLAYRPEKLNISNIIDHTLTALNYAASSKNITLKKLIPNDVLILTDENMLKTVLRNLIGNAIKFSYKNSEIKVEVIEEKLQLVINIVDTGLGIKEETLAKIFSPDFNTSNTGTANERGTGLGLKICKEFIHKWGGRIWVESIYGKGSTFSFSLPK